MTSSESESSDASSVSRGRKLYKSGKKKLSKMARSLSNIRKTKPEDDIDPKPSTSKARERSTSNKSEKLQQPSSFKYESEDEKEKRQNERKFKNSKKKDNRKKAQQKKKKTNKTKKTRNKPVDSSDPESEPSTEDEINSSSDYSDTDTESETGSSAGSPSDTQDSDEDIVMTTSMFKKMWNKQTKREAKLQQSRKYAKSCITAPNKYLVKGTHIDQRVLSKIFNDLGSRKGMPELQQNNLCSFVDAFNPMVKDRFKKGKPLTNAEYNWLLSQYLSKDIKTKYYNENIEHRKVSSDTFLKELSTLVYERTPTVQSVIEEIEDYTPDKQSKNNILAILSDLKKIVYKVPTGKWKREKRNKLLYKKIKDYLSYAQIDALTQHKVWDSKQERFIHPDYYALKAFLEERESDINGYLKVKSSAKGGYAVYSVREPAPNLMNPPPPAQSYFNQSYEDYQPQNYQHYNQGRVNNQFKPRGYGNRGFNNQTKAVRPQNVPSVPNMPRHNQNQKSGSAPYQPRYYCKICQATTHKEENCWFHPDNETRMKNQSKQTKLGCLKCRGNDHVTTACPVYTSQAIPTPCTKCREKRIIAFHSELICKNK